MKIVKLLSLFLLVTVSLYGQWRPDVLGGDFRQLTFEMGDDYEGRVVSTLVRLPAKEPSVRAVLYIHGYSDYFFQRDMAERFSDSLYNFYAIDLRKYGRSILPHQCPYNVREVDEYFADIDMAIATMKEQGCEHIVLMGHSTGGLIASLYAVDNHVDGLILNSPFLDMNFGWVMENLVIPPVALYGAVDPKREVVQSKSTAYAESLLAKYHGEWEYNVEWKPIHSLPITAGWLHAITAAHRRVQAHDIDIKCPILLLSSDNSVYGDEFHPGYMGGDGVLSVEDIMHYGRRLGKRVSAVQISGGIHDLILSPLPAREDAYETIFGWLRERW